MLYCSHFHLFTLFRFTWFCILWCTGCVYLLLYLSFFSLKTTLLLCSVEPSDICAGEVHSYLVTSVSQDDSAWYLDSLWCSEIVNFYFNPTSCIHVSNVEFIQFTLRGYDFCLKVHFKMNQRPGYGQSRSYICIIPAVNVL